MKQFFCLLSMLFIAPSFAQKQFNNGFSLSVGTAYLPENDEYLIRELTFTSKPNFGVKLGYERRFGKVVSVQISGAYFIAKTSSDVFIEINPDEPAGVLTNTIQRYEGKLGVDFWAVSIKKYAFTPGIGLHFGQTFKVTFSGEDKEGAELFPEQTESVSNNYITASLSLANRFELSRFRSERKGTVGALYLLVTPYFAYNVSKVEVAEWTNPKPNIFGGGLNVGLQYSF